MIRGRLPAVQFLLAEGGAQVLHCCYTAVTPLSYCWYTVVTLLLNYCYTEITLRVQCGYTVVTLLLHRCHTVVTLLRATMCYTVVTLLLHR
jgi:histone acetyltransferase (RNA polymerase elongator complex component)